MDKKQKKKSNRLKQFLSKLFIGGVIISNMSGMPISAQASPEKSDNSNNASKITNLVPNSPNNDFPPECLNVKLLVEHLYKKGFTFSDIIETGIIDKNEFATFKYSNYDLDEISQSPLMEKLLINLQNNLLDKSSHRCTEYVRKAWYQTTEELETQKTGVNSNQKIIAENLWCSTERGFAKDWPEAIENNSNLLISLGEAKADKSGNINFDFIKYASNFICIAPGIGNEAGHAWMANHGEQLSDFRSNMNWILQKMSSGEYEKKIKYFVATDSKAPKMLIEKTIDRMLQQYDSSKELLNQLGENNINKFYSLPSYPFEASTKIADIRSKISISASIDNTLNTDTRPTINPSITTNTHQRNS